MPGHHRVPQHASACPAGCAVRLQPNHPTDDPHGHRRLDPRRPAARLRRRGDRHQSGHRQHPAAIGALLRLLDDVIARATRSRPRPACWPMSPPRSRCIEQGAPVDLVFQSIAGTEAANRSFGVDLALLRRGARGRAVAAARHASGDNVMYFETGQGSRAVGRRASRRRPADPARRAPMPSRAPSSRCWSTPWSASSARNTSTTASRSSAPGWRTISAASCSACRWACDVCYTNHAEADQDDMDTLLTLLGVAGVTFIMGVPGADDVMLNYQIAPRSTTRSICATRSACARRRSSRPGSPAWASAADAGERDSRRRCRPR